MSTEQRHIIRRQYLDVEARGTEAGGLALQRRLPGMCQNDLVPALERMLDRVVPRDQHLTIDRMEIDAGSMRLDDLERVLPGAVAQAIEKRIREITPAIDGIPAGRFDPVRRRSESQSVHEAFLYFLKTGALPWWFRMAAGETLERRVRECWRGEGQLSVLPQPFRGSVVDAISAPYVRTRLVGQFSAAFQRELLASLSPEGARALDSVLATLESDHWPSTEIQSIRMHLWRAAFAGIAQGRSLSAHALISDTWSTLPKHERERPPLAAAVKRSWRQAMSALDPQQLEGGAGATRDRLSGDPPPRRSKRHLQAARMPVGTDQAEQERTDRTGRDETSERINIEEGVHIDNAGLVILHPFLPQLFETLDIAVGDRLEQPDRALCLLHFLATGREFAPEYELAFPKVLCGMPLEATVDSHVALTVAERKEAEVVLGAVIRHWEALGNTSLDGLRGTFLIRPGKLSRRQDGEFLLQAEARSFDILLDRLPWGIGAIKLPWMNRMLWVEWPDGA